MLILFWFKLPLYIFNTEFCFILKIQNNNFIEPCSSDTSSAWSSCQCPKYFQRKLQKLCRASCTIWRKRRQPLMTRWSHDVATLSRGCEKIGPNFFPIWKSFAATRTWSSKRFLADNERTLTIRRCKIKLWQLHLYLLCSLKFVLFCDDIMPYKMWRHLQV